MSLLFETLAVRKEGAVLFAEILAPPMNLLGPELVRDLVSLIQRAEADDTLKVLVFSSGDPDDDVEADGVTVFSWPQVLVAALGRARTAVIGPLVQHEDRKLRVVKE